MTEFEGGEIVEKRKVWPLVSVEKAVHKDFL